MWNPNYPIVNNSHGEEDDDSWEVKAFAEDTRNATGMTWPPRSYTCTFCRREFQSAQALGGHMNVHRRDRARLHQSQPSSFRNPNLSSSSSSSSTLLIPTQELVANGTGLCLLYSIPNPNAIFNPSFFNNVQGNCINPSISNLPHPNTDKFVSFPASVTPHHHSFNSSVSDSRNTKESNHISNEEVVTSVDKKRRKTDSSVAGIDLELRLGCS